MSLLVLASAEDFAAFALTVADTMSLNHCSMDDVGESGADEFDSSDGALVIAPRNSDDFLGLLEAISAGVSLPAGPIGFAVPFSSATALASMLAGAGIERDFYAISFVPGLTNSSSRIEWAPAMQSLDAEGQIETILGKLFDSERLELVEDRVGLVGLRILAMIINEATFALLEGVAGADDVDTAMKLGTAYPRGPLEWCDAIGADVVVDVLDALQLDYGEERYRPSILLRQHARAGVPFSLGILAAGS